MQARRDGTRTPDIDGYSVRRRGNRAGQPDAGARLCRFDTEPGTEGRSASAHARQSPAGALGSVAADPVVANRELDVAPVAVADRQRRPMAVELAARQQAHRCEQLRPETVEHGQQPDPRQRDRAGQKPPLAPPRRASSGAAYLYLYRGIRTWLGHLAAADADRAPTRQTILARP
jgi:hypothetical protein